MANHLKSKTREKNHSPKAFLASFSRAQVASAIATLVDYFVLFGLTEIFGVWYVLSVALGAAIAAIVNFLLNRYWSFQAIHQSWKQQAIRYGLISAGSLVLNTVGVYAMTETAGVHYALSVVIISVLVGWFFNYPLHRYFVFR